MEDKGREENRLPRIYETTVTEIDDFSDHLYQVCMDEDMEQLVESVKERGIITPMPVRRKENGKYKMISGMNKE